MMPICHSSLTFMGFGAPFALLWTAKLVQTASSPEHQEDNEKNWHKLVAFKDIQVFAPDDAVADLKIFASDASAIVDIAHKANLGSVKLRLSDAPWESKEARPRCVCKRIAVWDPFRDGLSKNVVMEMDFYSGAYHAEKLKEIVAAMATKPGVKRMKPLQGSTLTTSVQPVLATEVDARSSKPELRSSRMPMFFLTLGLCLMATGVFLGVCAMGKRRQLIRQTCGGKPAAHTRGVHCITLLEEEKRGGLQEMEMDIAGI
jgi:hypothetical protein